MKEIELGFYRRYIGNDRFLTIEVIQKNLVEPKEWIKDEALTVVSRYQRKVGTVLFRVNQNEPIEATLYQIKYDELPENEWYEFFTAGMSDIHPNDKISS